MSLVERRRSCVHTISTANKCMVIYLMTGNDKDDGKDDGMTLIRYLRKTKFYLHKNDNNHN